MTDTDNQSSSEENTVCVARFEIHYRQILDHNAVLTSALPTFAQDAGSLITLYRMMVKTRIFDSKAIALQRTGKMGTYASSLGQEAVAVGIGQAMSAEDVLVPTYREYGAQLQRGVSMTDLLLYWGGDERGMSYAQQPQDLPISVPIATHLPHAAGVATAFKLRNEPRVAVAVLGDGGSSKGDFYEALNLAGVWQLPMVIVINNNQWAISVPRKNQSLAQTLAQKAIAGGVQGEQVDGNDVIAMRHCMSEAIERARNGGGPSVIEALTYRMSDHTTADDASRYRATEEVQQQQKYDPIKRLHDYLMQTGNWNEKKDQALHAECAVDVEKAVQAYFDTPPAPPESMFDYLYETLPDAYQAQRAELIQQGVSNKGASNQGTGNKGVSNDG